MDASPRAEPMHRRPRELIKRLINFARIDETINSPRN
jgi:hypothetical protein